NCTRCQTHIRKRKIVRDESPPPAGSKLDRCRHFRRRHAPILPSVVENSSKIGVSCERNAGLSLLPAHLSRNPADSHVPYSTRILPPASTAPLSLANPSTGGREKWKPPANTCCSSRPLGGD